MASPPPRLRSVPACLLLGLTMLASGVGRAAILRTFITSAACNGDIASCTPQVGDTGVTAGNNYCQNAASAAGLTPGSEQFVAWISDSATDAACNVRGLTGKLSDVPACGQPVLPEPGPWARLDGLPLNLSFPDLLGDGPLAAPQIDENGIELHRLAFETGSDQNGALSVGNACDDWTRSTMDPPPLRGGLSDVTSQFWSSGALTNCSTTQRLLCVELGSGDALSYPHLAGSLVFVTSETGTGDLSSWTHAGGQSGIAAGDAVCQHAALTADLPSPSSFKAWLSDDVQDAKDLLTAPGPWLRVDGMPVADSPADLLDATLRTSIGVDETGARSLGDPWTGTADDGTGTGTGFNCGLWADSDGGTSGTVGHADRTTTWSGLNPHFCDSVNPLYCFSNVVLLGWDNFESGDLRRWSTAVP